MTGGLAGSSWARYGYQSDAVRDADVSIAKKNGLNVVVSANGRWLDGSVCYKLEVSRD